MYPEINLCQVADRDIIAVKIKENDGEKTIYLCKGKRELKRRSFGKVVGEAVGLLKYADYV